MEELRRSTVNLLEELAALRDEGEALRRELEQWSGPPARHNSEFETLRPEDLEGPESYDGLEFEVPTRDTLRTPPMLHALAGC